MSFVKLGESVAITSEDIQSTELVLSELDDTLTAENYLEQFKKTAAELKVIAPKAKDFLYFTAIMMHAAEASLLDDNGEIRKNAKGEPVIAKWEKNDKTGSWKWVCTDENIKPYKNSNCFIAGTKILMADGSVKNIEDIKVGDEVITHKNRVKKVSAVFVNDHVGDIIKLQTSHNIPVYCTQEHPIFVARNTTKDSNTKRALANNKLDNRFVEVKDILNTDHVLGPILTECVESDLTSSQARLLGLYAAEGSLRRNGIVLSFSAKEYDNLASEAAELFKKEFPNSTINLANPTHSQPTKCSLYVSGEGVSEFFNKYVGQYSAEKKLSKEIVFGLPEIKQQFILGWLEGDGSVDKQSGKIVGTTVSESMASQIRVMLNSLNINNTHQIQQPSNSVLEGGRKIIGKYDVQRIKIPYNEAKVFIEKSAKLAFNKDVKEVKINVFNNGYSYHSVIEKSSLPFAGKIYNFEVEDDHSYVANGMIVHNCDIFPEEELKKAYKKWVGKPLCLDHKSNSVDFIRGVIVDTFYDEKLKRVVALCALDKVNYPDLARKVSTGYATCVSMGTAVGRAICFDCGRAAKVESDFCDHMRSRSCYGEVNVDLSPIELSIVVNGADPKAKIRHVVAAADSIAKYIDNKSDLIAESKDVLSTVEIEQLEADLVHAQETLKKLKVAVEENAASEEDSVEDSNSDSDSPAYGQPGRGTVHMSEIDLENTNRSYGPGAKMANSNDVILSKLTSVEEKLSDFINKMASLQSDIKNNKEIEMSTDKKAYFQGGGGANEPAPKQVKYTKEDSDSIRDSQDKQMDGQSETGPVDGMHPGYDSYGESEEARKKRLLRASEEERKLRREAALEAAKKSVKEAYHQGGGGANEPTPGKPKYEKEDSDSIRNKQDKQMNGESPFPGVGKTDGLYGDDLKKKQMLSRAKLNANFVKAANPDGSDNLSESRWQVYADKKLILTATVGDLAGDKAEFLYDSIATKEFGKKLLATIKSQGFDKAVSLVKGAQSNLDALVPEGARPTKEELDKVEGFRMLNDGKWPESFTKKYPTYAPYVEGIVKGAQAVPPAAGPSAAPSGPVDAGLPAETPALPEPEMDDKSSDLGDSGDPAEQLDNHLGELDGLIADMKKAWDALKEEDTSDLDAMAPATASVTLPEMRKTLNVSLQKGMKQAVAELEDHKEELTLLKHVYNNSDSVSEENLKFVNNLAEQAFSDVKNTVANIRKLQSAFVKYARGTDALLKKAAEEAKLAKTAQLTDELDDNDKPRSPGDAGDPDDWRKALKELDEAMNPSGRPGAGLPGRPAPPPAPSMKPKKDPKPEMFEPKPLSVDDTDENDAVEFKMNPDGSLEGTADQMKDLTASASASSTKEERAKMRAKLAQKGLQFSDMLGKAHPGGGTTIKLDTKPEGDLAKVEDLEEVHSKMMDVATTAPRKVREAAESIQRLVVAGKIDPEKDFDGLVAEGLDPAAVKYWKQFFGEAKDGGSEFASELVKEHSKKKAAEEMEAYRVKIARAYELAHDMADHGLIGNTREAVHEQVKSILEWNDASFNSMKNVVARTPIAKKASALPAVGYTNDSLMGASEVVVVPESNSSDLVRSLEAAFRGRKY